MHLKKIIVASFVFFQPAWGAAVTPDSLTKKQLRQQKDGLFRLRQIQSTHQALIASMETGHSLKVLTESAGLDFEKTKRSMEQSVLCLCDLDASKREIELYGHKKNLKDLMAKLPFIVPPTQSTLPQITTTLKDFYTFINTKPCMTLILTEADQIFRRKIDQELQIRAQRETHRIFWTKFPKVPAG